MAFLMVTAVVALMPSLASSQISVTESAVTLCVMACFQYLKSQSTSVPLVIVKAPVASIWVSEVDEMELSERTFTVSSAEKFEVIDESVKSPSSR